MITVVRAFSCNSVPFLQHAIHLKKCHDGFRFAWYFLGRNVINIVVETWDETFTDQRP